MDVVLDTRFNNPYLTPESITPFFDDFNRTDAALLGNTPVGDLPWELATSAGTPSAGVISRAGYVAVSGSGRAYATVNAGYADGIFVARAASDPATFATNTYAVVVRYVDPSNHLFLVVVSGTWRLYKRVAGTTTQLVFTGVTAALGDRIEIEMHGKPIRVRINGAVVADVSVDEFVTAKRHGIFGPGATTEAKPTLWDDVGLNVPGAWR